MSDPWPTDLDNWNFSDTVPESERLGQTIRINLNAESQTQKLSAHPGHAVSSPAPTLAHTFDLNSWVHLPGKELEYPGPSVFFNDGFNNYDISSTNLTYTPFSTRITSSGSENSTWSNTQTSGGSTDLFSDVGPPIPFPDARLSHANPSSSRVSKVHDTHVTSKKKRQTSCGECNRDFRTVSNYNKHRRDKHERARYACGIDECPKTFFRNAYKRRHQVQAHNRSGGQSWHRGTDMLSSTEGTASYLIDQSMRHRIMWFGNL